MICVSCEQPSETRICATFDETAKRNILKAMEELERIPIGQSFDISELVEEVEQ